mmetsp:Transcript_34770/g.70983  ORF Transcript_34770/g.70983 Transcript_34770/m.70983 type:complete len:245 (-) Transcript_34770:35-769(-)
MANNHHEYEEVHLTDDDDAEDIELVSGGVGGRQRRAAPPLSSSGGGGSTTKWIVILFLIVLVGVYKLGMEEGKAEVQHEGFDGGDGINDNYSDVDVKQTQHEDDDTKDAAVQEEQIKKTETTTTTTTTVPPKPPMKFTMDHLTAMRTECNNLINTLNDYYYGEDKAIAMLMNSHIAPWDFNEVELDHVESTDESTFVNQYPPRKLRAVKLVNTMLRALVSDSQRTFLMGGIGSSVMAGGDYIHY